MKRNAKLGIMAAAVLLALSSCTQEDVIEQTGYAEGTPVNFIMGVNGLTRTVTDESSNVTTFEENDRVGIFAYNGATAVRSNVAYTYNGTDNWTTTEGDIEIPGDQTYYYYAYYPYQESAAISFPFTVERDQSVDYNTSDFLYAENTTTSQGDPNVTLEYDHAFSLVQVTLQSSDVTLTDAVVTLENVLPTATVNLNDHSVNGASGDLTSITMCRLSTGDVYRAIIPAQAINAGTKVLSIAVNGTNYQFTHTEDIKFGSGQIRKLVVTVGTAPVSSSAIDIEEDVNGWTDDATTVTGDSQEEIIPIIQPFGDALIEVTQEPSSTISEDCWFGLSQNQTVYTNAEIGYDLSTNENETTWGVAGYFTYTSKWNTDSSSADSNSWFKGALGYLHTSPMDVSTTSIYRVTLKIKGEENENGTASRLVFTCRNANNDASFAISTNSTNYTATSVTIQPTTASTWQDYTFYIDFSRKYGTVGSLGNNSFTTCDASDYARFDLRVYPNDAASETVQSVKAEIYISDVVMEPYTTE